MIRKIENQRGQVTPQRVSEVETGQIRIRTLVMFLLRHIIIAL